VDHSALTATENENAKRNEGVSKTKKIVNMLSDDTAAPAAARTLARAALQEGKLISDYLMERLHVVVGHAPTALVFLDIISGVVAANAGDALGPCGPWIAHPRAIRNALTRAKRIGQPTASARTKFGSLVCGATRRRNTKTAAAASQTKSRVPEDRRLNSVVSSSVLIARLQRSTPTIGIVRF
jgi:hypothetical protein